MDKNYVYLLWEDKVIIGCYTSFDAANEALYDLINNDNIIEVKWANESCGFTTVKTGFGETIEYEIGEVKVNG